MSNILDYVILNQEPGRLPACEILALKFLVKCRLRFLFGAAVSLQCLPVCITVFSCVFSSSLCLLLVISITRSRTMESVSHWDRSRRVTELHVHIACFLSAHPLLSGYFETDSISECFCQGSGSTEFIIACITVVALKLLSSWN